MSDPKYNTYAGELRFDDDNIVDVNLEPDTRNITVLLNGEEVTGGAELPEVTSSDNGDVLMVVEGVWAKADPPTELPAVTSSDNGDVLMVVEGVWAKADPPTELPAVTSSDNGDVLTVVNGAWAKAAPAVGIVYFDVGLTYDDQTGDVTINTLTTTTDIKGFINSGLHPIAKVQWTGNPEYQFFNLSYLDMAGNSIIFDQVGVDESSGVIRTYITFYKDDEVDTASCNMTFYPSIPV